jgi:hypothetical protein
MLPLVHSIVLPFLLGFASTPWVGLCGKRIDLNRYGPAAAGVNRRYLMPAQNARSKGPIRLSLLIESGDAFACFSRFARMQVMF